MRKTYRMTDTQWQQMLHACRPRPLMYLSGGMPMGPTPQESADDAWRALGAELGFDWKTVQPHGDDPREFSAEDKRP